MIPYRIFFWKKAEADFLKLPKEIQERIAGKLNICQANPFHYFTRLKGRSDYKLRVGDYRISADIKQNERVIEVTKIGHRRNFYAE